jgi:hypothetical protein
MTDRELLDKVYNEMMDRRALSLFPPMFYDDSKPLFSETHPQKTPWYKRVWFWFFPPKMTL